MHISDGILSAPVWIGGFLVTAGVTAVALRNIEPEDIPKVSVITSAFFVGSLIHVPIGPSSIHLTLNGLAGVILGWQAFPAILIGLVLQAFLLQHGGVTTIGVNSVIMGIPALGGYLLFQLHHRFESARMKSILGGMAGALAILLSNVFLAAVLATTRDEFLPVAKLIFIAHLPLVLIEGLIAGLCVGFLEKVKPGMLP